MKCYIKSIKLLMDDEAAVFYEAIHLIDIVVTETCNNLNKAIIGGDLVRILISKYEKKFDCAVDNSLINFNFIHQLVLATDTVPLELILKIIQAYNVLII